MRIVSATEIHGLLDYPGLVEALRTMFRNGCEVPPRHHHPVAVPDAAAGTLLLMPAWQPGRHLGVKIVTVFPDNAAASLPAVYGSYVLLNATTGAPVALLDGTALTLRRTAAASALAADYLARRDSAVHLVVGTGALAPHLAAAHAAMRPIRETRIWGRDPAKAEQVARRLEGEGLSAVPVRDLAGAAATADVITCATLSYGPLIRGEWLRPGTHLDLVGGFRPDMREADDEAVRRATVYIDTDAALHEAGDLTQPLASGVLTLERIAGDLFALARCTSAGRQSAAEITLFKSVGTALEDLAAAELAVGRLDRNNPA
ncbi:MAG TPA: ornithine cyclodeaminase family protein [Stellaceae bacterium]|jgi:ornithine cyclodeaminase|nr:ornithine cyclodeaminase family protein [Stellaceae bacterium]